MRILIIDDNKEITDLLHSFLSRKGHNCTVANDGRNGLTLMENENFDVVLLDLYMNDFTGIDVVESLVKTDKIKEQRIIILTASEGISNKDVDWFKKQGIRAFLRKPVTMNVLLDAINSLSVLKYGDMQK